jgi:hypothetical protein
VQYLHMMKFSNYFYLLSIDLQEGLYSLQKTPLESTLQKERYKFSMWRLFFSFFIPILALRLFGSAFRHRSLKCRTVLTNKARSCYSLLLARHNFKGIFLRKRIIERKQALGPFHRILPPPPPQNRQVYLCWNFLKIYGG